MTQVRNEITEIKRAKQQEDDRNVDLAVKFLLSHIEYKHQELRGQRVNVKVSTGSNINQVTAGEIKRAAEDAYKQGRLYEFERFAGELWTRPADGAPPSPRTGAARSVLRWRRGQGPQYE